MVIRVEYHIDRDYFIKNKKAIQKLLRKPAFEIAVMKFEKGMTDKDIAKYFKLPVLMVRKILSFSCKRIREYRLNI